MANQTAQTAPATSADPHAGHDMTAMKSGSAEKTAGGDGHSDPQAHASTEAAHGGGEHAVPSAFGFDATMLVALAMLVVIGLAIWKKVPALIGGMLDKQIAGIKEQLDAATKLRAEAEAIKAEYEAKAKQAAADADAMRVNAGEEAKLIVANAKKDAAAMIARRSKMAEDKIAAAENAAIAEVRATAASTAAAAAEHIIISNADGKLDASLIDASIAKLN
jgi:F-type H+-transporting ATPase subunit b